MARASCSARKGSPHQLGPHPGTPVRCAGQLCWEHPDLGRSAVITNFESSQDIKSQGWLRSASTRYMSGGRQTQSLSKLASITGSPAPKGAEEKWERHLVHLGPRVKPEKSWLQQESDLAKHCRCQPIPWEHENCSCFTIKCLEDIETSPPSYFQIPAPTKLVKAQLISNIVY